MAYAECFVLMLPLRECAWRCRVCLKTAYTMRRRLIECLSAYSPSFGAGRGSSTRAARAGSAERSIGLGWRRRPGR